MYERSAVILERYFAERFYYNKTNNIKSNCTNYYELVEKLEEYQEITQLEDKAIAECEDIAARISKTQKEQKSLYKKALKMHEERNSLFENIGETADKLEKNLDKLEVELDKNSEEMKPIVQEFKQEIKEFNEKSTIRADYGKKRKKIESQYRNTLEKATEEFINIDLKELKNINTFMASETIDTDDLKTKMIQNGKNEKVPFSEEVIEQAIILGQDLHKKEAELFVEIYGKMKILLSEINNNTVNIAKHKKIAKNSKNKLAFIKAEKEYLIQFLDNERLSVSLGKKEHTKLMKEACSDLEKDTEQIKNLYEILLKEIGGKATQKMYKELYNRQYVEDLEESEKEFNLQLSKLGLVGKIINPIYWRIDGMKKIYTTFDNIVKSEYERDLQKVAPENAGKILTEKDSPKDEESIQTQKGETLKSSDNKETKKDTENEADLNEETEKDEEKTSKNNKKTTNSKEGEPEEEKKEKTNKDKTQDDEEYEDINTMLKKRKDKIKKGQNTQKSNKSGKKNGFFGKFVKLS